MSFSKPAGLDSFRRCLHPGCEMVVYAPMSLPVACREHHGDPALPQFHAPDEYGQPRRPAAVAPPDRRPAE